MADLAHAALDQPGHWQAFLRLRFARQAGRTVLASRSHRGPLQVQKPFYPEATGACHVYVLHPPGGIAGGDELSIDVGLDNQAHALLTTPAASKFYRSNGPVAKLTQTLQVGADAVLEWLPQETIVFDAALAESLTKVTLGERGKFFGWEITCFGRPAASERFSRGRYRSSFEIWRNGLPLWIERTLLLGDDPLFTATFGMQKFSVSGTFVYVGNLASGLQALRDIAQTEVAANALFSVTQMKEILLIRYLGHHAEQARSLFTQAWKIARPMVLGCDVHVPRIWHT